MTMINRMAIYKREEHTKEHTGEYGVIAKNLKWL